MFERLLRRGTDDGSVRVGDQTRAARSGSGGTTWHVWLSRGLRRRFQVVDADGEVLGSFARMRLGGDRTRVGDRDGDALDLGLDAGDVVVFPDGGHAALVRVERERLHVGSTVLEFAATRDRTCRAEVADAERVLLTAGPVRARSYRPFLRLDIAPDLPSPDLVAIAVAYLLARDVVGIGASAGDLGPAGA